MRTLFFSLFLGIPLFVSAQITAIPDADFEQALIDMGIDSDGTVNNQVLSSDISGVTSLDVSGESISDLTGIEGFTSLVTLNCDNNSLSGVLNTSMSPNLMILRCNDNLLTGLNITLNAKLTHLFCYSNEITMLDVSDNPDLELLNCNHNLMDWINVTQNLKLETLNCDFNEIYDIDISNNTALTLFRCTNNNIGILDLSNNTALNLFFCGTNDLAALNLVNNTQLTSLSVTNNDLVYLNVSNGNNSILTSFFAQGNATLTCIEVDDETAATAGAGSYAGWIKDPVASYSEGCTGYTIIPDIKFENALISEGVDSDPVANGVVLTAEVSSVTNLNLFNKLIDDLTGIEDFTSLTILTSVRNRLTTINLSQNTNLSILVMNTNMLTSLDLSKNIALTKLECMSNSLSSLDLSKNILLDGLRCSKNQITSLDLRQNPKLLEVSCYGNQLSTIDISGNPLLEILNCDDNLLTNISLSNNPALIDLSVSKTKLTSLDLSSNSNLTKVWCYLNRLTELNVKNGNNTILTDFESTGNLDLSCIQVDNAVDANAGIGSYSSWSKDATSSFSDNCSSSSVSLSLIAGWTWFSINIETTDMSLGALLSNLTLTNGDYIKSKTQSASYYDGVGWFGDLTALNAKETYKIKMAVAGTIILEGSPADPGGNPIPIGTGWNWIGYVPQGPLNLDEALTSISPMANDYIKSQSQSATFYDGVGWFGDLSLMEALEGYMFKSGKDETLTYPGTE